MQTLPLTKNPLLQSNESTRRSRASTSPTQEDLEMVQSKNSPWLTLKSKIKAGQSGRGSASSLMVCTQKACNIHVSLPDKWNGSFQKETSFFSKSFKVFFHLDIFHDNSLTLWETLQCWHKCPPQTDRWNSMKLSWGFLFTCQNIASPHFENQIMAMIGIHFKSSFSLLLILKLHVESRLLWYAPAYWSNESLTGLPWLPKITNANSHWPY